MECKEPRGTSNRTEEQPPSSRSSGSPTHAHQAATVQAAETKSCGEAAQTGSPCAPLWECKPAQPL